MVERIFIRLVTGTGNEDVGDHDVTVRVTDSAGATDTKTFTLTVNNTNVSQSLFYATSTDEVRRLAIS